MQLERTLRLTTESGLVLSIITVMAFAGCGGGGSTNGTTTVQIGGSRQGTPLNLTTAVSTLAGSGTAGAADNTTGTLATFNQPQGITTDGTNLYVADYVNNTIRKIVITSGAVTSLAGSAAAAAGASDHTTGTLATFSAPVGITTDGFNLYVADSKNNSIRKIVIANGAVTTLAGSAAAAAGALDNTNGTLATFQNPRGITTDGTNLYVADSFNNMIRMIVIASGSVTTLAGQAVAGTLDNAIGTQAKFNHPNGITTDGRNLYVTDNNTIRKIVISSGSVTTLAGQAGVAGALDNAIGTSATFSAPDGITTDGTSLFVSDTVNNKIRKIAIATGAVTTLAGSGSGGAADNTNGLLATFLQPGGITTDGTNLYVADTINNKIRKIQ